MIKSAPDAKDPSGGSGGGKAISNGFLSKIEAAAAGVAAPP
jgi:hypothetical protein